jgi:hypothetical protein
MALAVSDDPAATVTTEYFYHIRPRTPNPASRDTERQMRVLNTCQRFSGPGIADKVRKISLTVFQNVLSLNCVCWTESVLSPRKTALFLSSSAKRAETKHPQ